MRTVILPDLHDRIYLADKVLRKEKGNYDQAVLLGDCWDNFHTGAKEAIRTTLWLENFLKDPRHRVIYGNHDLYYLYPWQWTRSSGYTEEKYQAILSVLKPWMIAKFELYSWVDGWLASHAGLSANLPALTWLSKFTQGLDAAKETKSALATWLELESKRCLKDLRNGFHNRLLEQGEDRGGRQGVIGGLVWCGWESLRPIPFIDQIVGHTARFKEVRDKHTATCKNVCIDTCSKHYAFIENSHLTVKEA